MPLLVLGLFSVVSCLQDDPSFFRRNMPGTWCSPEGVYYTFQTGSTAYAEGVGAADDGGQTWLEGRLTYQVNCCSMQYSGTWSGIEPYPAGTHLYREVELIEMNDSLLVFRNRVLQANGQQVSTSEQETWTRSVADLLKDSLTGVWQSVSKDGVTSDRYRFEFLKGSEYRYYEYVSGADTTGWILKEDNAGTWVNYDRNLILTMFDNEAWGTQACSSVLRVQVPVISPISGRMEWTTETGNWLFKRLTEEE